MEESVEPGHVVHTDGWLGYAPLESKGYIHEITFLRGKKKSPSELMPRVHRVVSLLKRWLLGTHQGAVSAAHLDYYLDEFTFRFNRRKSRSRGKLFFRLVAAGRSCGANNLPVDHRVRPGWTGPGTTSRWVHLSEVDTHQKQK